MFSEYLCHGWKPDTSCYCCSRVKCVWLCHCACCDFAVIALGCRFARWRSSDSKNTTALFAVCVSVCVRVCCYSSLVQLPCQLWLQIPAGCCHPRCHPVTHQPLEDVKQGRGGLQSQQTSVSLRVTAKSAISSWLDRTLCLMNLFFFVLYACQCFKGLTIQKQHYELPVLRRLNGLKIDLSAAEPL